MSGVRKFNGEEGFTLLELCIVILILGIVITIAVVNYANVNRGMALKGALRQLEAALNRAKTSARQENVKYRMVIYGQYGSPYPNSYEFYHNVENNGTWSLQPVDKSVSGEEVVIDDGHYYIKISNGVKVISDSNITVDFSPNGTTIQITSVTINLDIGGATGTVRVDAQGRVVAQ